MELEITPEPSDDERAAIAAALGAAEDEAAPRESAWRTAGVLEATGHDAEA